MFKFSNSPTITTLAISIGSRILILSGAEVTLQKSRLTKGQFAIRGVRPRDVTRAVRGVCAGEDTPDTFNVRHHKSS